MNVLDAMQHRRSIRKFLPKEVSIDTLTQILDLARLYPTGGNMQPLRFAIITNPEHREAIFADIAWAMYLPEFEVQDYEQPTAYIALLRDDRVLHSCDYEIGAASTMIMIAAVAEGLASCPVGNFSAKRLSSLLNLTDNLKPELVIALGYPAQESHVIPMSDSVEYSEDANKDFLVPKWGKEDVLIFSD